MIEELKNWIIENYPECKIAYDSKSYVSIAGGEKFSFKGNEFIATIQTLYFNDATTLSYQGWFKIFYVINNSFKTNPRWQDIETFCFRVIADDTSFINKFKKAFEFAYKPIKENTTEKYAMHIENIKNIIALEKLD